MWTMVSEIRYNRGCYHLTDGTFITFCGNRNMLVRDYVENRNGELVMVDQEGGIVISKPIPKYRICKKCFRSPKNNQLLK